MSIMVLAIDDSRTIRSMVHQALAAAGFSCELAEDGVEGVRRFEELRPDVVITDINMPHMDGFGVIEAIRKDVGNRQGVQDSGTRCRRHGLDRQAVRRPVACAGHSSCHGSRMRWQPMTLFATCSLKKPKTCLPRCRMTSSD